MAVQGAETQQDRVVDTLESIPCGNTLIEYVHGERDRDTIQPNEWTTTIKKSEGELALQFPSAEGHHYVVFSENKGLVATYVGPFGAENRPTPIADPAVEQLLEHADSVSIQPTTDSELADSIVSDLL